MCVVIERVKRMKKTDKYFIYSFMVALIILLITSKNSFLYIFNDWVDANAFFTVGKSMFHGIIPYKDLFEQKGPLLYLIYGLGYIISNKTFHGVFLLEVVSFTIFLYFVHKIFNMYFDKKNSLILLSFVSILITVSHFFVQGGSCEEFCLPFFAASLYYYLKHFKKGELTNKEILINGIIAGCILMTKYSLLGFWIGFCIFLSIYYLMKKKYKKLILFCFIFLLGMLIPFLIGVIYFLINDGLKEFIDVYFRLNMTAYTNVENYGIIKKIFEILKYISKELMEEKILIILPILALLTKEKDRIFRLSLVGLIFMTTLFIFFGLKSYIYYHLPIYLMTIVIALIFIAPILKKYTVAVFELFIISILLLAFKFPYYMEYMKNTKEDYVQYKYAEYINKYENPTLLNMGFLDIGVYTISGIVPNTRFFEVQNFDYNKFKDNLDEMQKYVQNKEVKFIVFAQIEKYAQPPKYIFDNYKQVYKDNYTFENNVYTSYLFELKEIV